MAISNSNIQKLLTQLMNNLDKQTGVKKPWRQYRFNSLYALEGNIDDEVNFAYTFKSWLWSLEFGENELQESEENELQPQTITRGEAYIRMFHCMVYLFSALMHPCSAWISRVENIIDPSSGRYSYKKIQDETKKMQTYVRKYMDSLSEDEREKFISDYMFDHGPFYIGGKLVFEPHPSKEDVIKALLNILKYDKGPAPHEDVPYIISQPVVHVPSSSSSRVVDIQSNVSWAIYGSSSNCSVNPASGYQDGNVFITVAENPTEDIRTFTLTVRDKDTENEIIANPFTIRVIQAETVKIEPELRVVLPKKQSEEPPTEIVVDSEGGTYKFAVFSNIEWQIYFPDEPNREKPKWIKKISPTKCVNNSYVNITFTKNIDTVDYTTKIVIDRLLPQRVEPITIPITQQAFSQPQQKLTIEPEELTISGINGSGYIDIKTEKEWKISDYTWWLFIDKSDRSGTGNKTIWYTALKNESVERKGSISVRLKNYDEEHTQIVHQNLAVGTRELSVYPENISIGAAGGIVTVWITSDTQWAFSSWDARLYINSIDPMNGEGIAEVTIDVRENQLEEENDFSISIYGRDAQTIKLNFKQEPAIIYPVTINPDTLMNVPSSGGTYDDINVFTIATDINWTVSGIADICTVSPQSGIGDGTVTVNVQRNPNTTPRIANVIFKAEGYGTDKDRTLKIIQLGQGQAPYSLIVNPDTLYMENTQSTKTFNIISNLDWKITSNHSWCTVNTSSGSDSKQITVSVTTNTGLQKNAVITVSSTDGFVEPVTVTVWQTAAT